MRRPLARRLRAGFTLIEMLAVILIIGILARFLLPNLMTAFERSRVTACRANMSEIYKGMLAYETKYKSMPSYSGAQFFCCLIERRVWTNTEQNAQRLTCPEVPYDTLPNLQGLDPEEWYVDLDSVNGDSTSYAGRDTKEHPIRRRSIENDEVLVADDNYPLNNHPSTTLALMGAGAVNEYELAELADDNLIDEEADTLEVGPTSPVEELTKLSLD